MLTVCLGEDDSDPSCSMCLQPGRLPSTFPCDHGLPYNLEASGLYQSTLADQGDGMPLSNLGLRASLLSICCVPLVTHSKSLGVGRKGMLWFEGTLKFMCKKLNPYCNSVAVQTLRVSCHGLGRWLRA